MDKKPISIDPILHLQIKHLAVSRSMWMGTLVEELIRAEIDRGAPRVSSKTRRDPQSALEERVSRLEGRLSEIEAANKGPGPNGQKDAAPHGLENQTRYVRDSPTWSSEEIDIVRGLVRGQSEANRRIFDLPRDTAAATQMMLFERDARHEANVTREIDNMRRDILEAIERSRRSSAD